MSEQNTAQNNVRSRQGVPLLADFASRFGTPLVIDTDSAIGYFVNPLTDTVTPLAGSGGSGTVTSVAQTVPVEFTITGSPITTSGTLAIGKATQSANRVWAGPTTGAAAQPTFRSLVAADIPAGVGDVVGPASAKDNEVVRFNGTTGKLIQDGTSVYITDSSQLIIGSPTAENLGGFTGNAEILGTTDDTSVFVVSRWSNDQSASNWLLGKSRGAAIGTNTIVQNGDFLGSINFVGATGTTFLAAANISGVIDGTPGATNDMPGKLLFRTTPDGSGSLAIRMEIRSDGHILVNTATNTASIGNIQIGTTSDTTDAAGILFGTDTQLFRGAANLLVAPDMISARATAGTPYTDTTTAASLFSVANNISLHLCDSARTANNRKADLVWGNGALTMRFVNDAYSAAADIWSATGGQGAGVTKLNFSTRACGAQGTAVTAANNMTLGNLGNYFQISGATQINLLVSTDWQGGSVVILKFNSNPVVKHAQTVSGVNKPIMLAGAVDFATSANDTLTLVYDSTDAVWYETARAVI